MKSQASADWGRRLSAIEVRGMSLIGEEPLVIAGGRGTTVFDADGNAYLDFCAGFGSLALGHRIPGAHVQERDLIQGMGDVHPSTDKIRLLEAIRAVLPSYLQRGVTCPTGSQAVEFAVRTAIMATRRPTILCFEAAYHGLDSGVSSLSDFPALKSPLSNSGWSPPYQTRRLPFGCSKRQLEEALAPRDVAAVIVEPIQGRGGPRQPPDGWLSELCTTCHTCHTYVIFDEIMCGFGRSGRLTFADHRGPGPDLVCSGKAMSGGMPIAVCFGTEEIMSSWPDVGEAPFTGTFWGHVLSCRVAYETVSTIVEENLSRQAAELGDRCRIWFQEQLGHKFSELSLCGTGLMLGIKSTKVSGFGHAVSRLAREHGMIVVGGGKHGEVCAITPPLNIQAADFERGLEILEKCIVLAADTLTLR